MRDLLTFTFGFGMVMEMFMAPEPWPIVSTVDDLHAFARMLLGQGPSVLAAEAVRQLTADQCTETSRTPPTPRSPDSIGRRQGGREMRLQAAG